MTYAMLLPLLLSLFDFCLFYNLFCFVSFHPSLHLPYILPSILPTCLPSFPTSILSVCLPSFLPSIFLTSILSFFLPSSPPILLPFQLTPHSILICREFLQKPSSVSLDNRWYNEHLVYTHVPNGFLTLEATDGQIIDSGEFFQQ